MKWMEGQMKDLNKAMNTTPPEEDLKANAEFEQKAIIAEEAERCLTMELKPRKDRYNPDNVYHIYIKMERHPGVKWVSFKDKQTGEVTKGLFIPDVETGCIKVRNGNMFLSFKAIPVKDVPIPM